MNRIVVSLTAIAAALVIASCSRGPEFSVEGTIGGAQDSTLYLFHRSMSGTVLLDSTKADGSGHFSISAAAPDSPDLYVLAVGQQGREYVNFSIDSTETVTINGQLPALAQNYSVSGSASSEKIRQLALMHSQLQQRVYNLEDNTALPPMTMLDSLQKMLRAYKDTLLRNYIVGEPQSAYAYFALSQKLGHRYAQLTNDIFMLGDSIDGIAYRAVATCWKQFYPESERAQQLWNMVERHINTTRKVAAKQQLLFDEGRVSVANLIDLSLPDRRNNMRTLTELKGQVVLLDFHLFASPESGARILKLRQLYDRYHDRGLEIYQVAVDGDEFQWKQATANLPWICVLDPTASSCMQYNVEAVPEFFLIDRDNSLQMRSSQVEDINKAIESLL